jgi:hypothetical protein
MLTLWAGYIACFAVIGEGDIASKLHGGVTVRRWNSTIEWKD